MDILLDSSHLDNLYLDIYNENVYDKCVTKASDQLYAAKLSRVTNCPTKLNFWDDPDGRPSLTNKQQKRLSSWVRLCELANNPKIICNHVSYERIQQGCIGNCSLLSSLISVANYDSKFNKGLISNIFLPNFANVCTGITNKINCVAGQKISKTEFVCRIYINGAARKIRVDDWVPIRSDGRLLCAHSTDINELWVTLLEKVFIKLLGNTYNVTGTNPCIDLYRFTNYLPEIVKLDASTNDSLWDDLYRNFKKGLVMSCLGTLTFDNVEINDRHELINEINGVSPVSGIVSNHAYSLIDLEEIDGFKLLYIKNPWGKISWKQRFSDFDSSEVALNVFKKLNHLPKKSDDGTFWIEWRDVIKWFSYLYISHDPKQFAYERTIHMKWNAYPHTRGSLLDDFYFMGFSPQIKVSLINSADTTNLVWVMVIQHKKSNNEELKYIATHLFFRDKQIISSVSPDIQGTYYNAECALNKFENLPQTFHLVTTLLDKPTFDSFNITIRLFSDQEFAIEKLKPPVVPNTPYLSIKSEWDERSGGVNDLNNYFFNPRIKFTLYQQSKVFLILESEEALHVNLKIFRGIDQLDYLLKQGKMVTSGTCKLHMCCVEHEFSSGIFTIIPSTYGGGGGYFRLVVYITPIDHIDYSDLDAHELGELIL